MYGPVRTVVWEGLSREAPPYPDFKHGFLPPMPARPRAVRLLLTLLCL